MVILKLIGMVILTHIILTFCRELDRLVEIKINPVEDYGNQEVTN